MSSFNYNVLQCCTIDYNATHEIQMQHNYIQLDAMLRKDSGQYGRRFRLLGYNVLCVEVRCIVMHCVVLSSAFLHCLALCAVHKERVTDACNSGSTPSERMFCRTNTRIL